EVDLLALGVGAGPVRDRHLEDDQALAEEVGGQLHLHGEALGGQPQPPERLAGEHLVAGVDVRQVAVEGHVDHQVEQPVGDPVGVVEAGRAAPEAAAVHDLVVAVQHRLDQGREGAGGVLEVGALDAEHVAGGGLQPGLDGRALAPVGGVHDHPDVVAGERVEQAAAGVGGPVVDEDQLRLQAEGVEVDLEEAVDDRRERPQFVVEGDDNRQLHGHLLPIRQQPAKYHVAAGFRREGRRPTRGRLSVQSSTSTRNRELLSGPASRTAAAWPGSTTATATRSSATRFQNLAGSRPLTRTTPAPQARGASRPATTPSAVSSRRPESSRSASPSPVRAARAAVRSSSPSMVAVSPAAARASPGGSAAPSNTSPMLGTIPENFRARPSSRPARPSGSAASAITGVVSGTAASPRRSSWTKAATRSGGAGRPGSRATTPTPARQHEATSTGATQWSADNPA